MRNESLIKSLLGITTKGILGFCVLLIFMLFIGRVIYTLFGSESLPPEPRKPKPNIEVFLPHRINTDNDKWARFSDGRLHTYELVTEECVVKIHLPSNKVLFYNAINADLTQTNEVLDTVYLRLPPETFDYQEAINNLEKELKKLSVDRSQECISGLNELRGEENINRPSGEKLGCYLNFEKEIKLRAGLKAFLVYTDMKWVTFLEFSSTKE